MLRSAPRFGPLVARGCFPTFWPTRRKRCAPLLRLKSCYVFDSMSRRHCTCRLRPGPLRPLRSRPSALSVALAAEAPVLQLLPALFGHMHVCVAHVSRYTYIPYIPVISSVCMFPRTYIHTYLHTYIHTGYVCFPGHTYMMAMYDSSMSPTNIHTPAFEVCTFGPCIHTYIPLLF